ncbi:MAG TPA: hypothetical protein PKM50_07100 [Methanoregula sp.]|nr:hypothetical protein [Methanoregula sp.]
MVLKRCTTPGIAACLVVALCLCAGCIFGPSENQTATNKTPVNVGIATVTGTGPHITYSLEDAVAAVQREYKYQSGGSQNVLRFYYTRGDNVDASGLAERWTFGVREGNNASMLVYDSAGMARIPWQAEGLPSDEIFFGNILLPEKIMALAYSGNLTADGPFVLEISRGEYTLSAPSGSIPREFVFNATTGELIATHD